MMGPIGGASSLPQLSNVQDLKSLLESVSDSKKAKEILSELDSKLTELQGLIRDNSEMQNKIDHNFKKLEDRDKELKLASEKLSQLEADLRAKNESISKKDSDLTRRERDLKVKGEEFEANVKTVSDELVNRELLSKNQYAESQSLKEQSAAIIKEYNQKVAKLQSFIGG